LASAPLGNQPLYERSHLDAGGTSPHRAWHLGADLVRIAVQALRKVLVTAQLLPVLGVFRAEPELCARRAVWIWLRRAVGNPARAAVLALGVARLLANTSIYATIWSFGLAVMFGVRNRTEWRALLPGAAIYLGLCVLAIATMIPAHDSSLNEPTLDIGRLNKAVRFVIGAFVPLFSSLLPSLPLP
jgi:hypothetical protein